MILHKSKPEKSRALRRFRRYEFCAAISCQGAFLTPPCSPPATVNHQKSYEPASTRQRIEEAAIRALCAKEGRRRVSRRASDGHFDINFARHHHMPAARYCLRASRLRAKERYFSSLEQIRLAPRRATPRLSIYFPFHDDGQQEQHTYN